jgi:hypothetical protein
MSQVLSCAVAGAAILTISANSFADEAPAATVAVRSNSPEVTIGYVTEHAAAFASNGAAAMGVAWKDVCIAPCEFKLPAGLHELTATGPGYVGAMERVQLEPGTNRFVVKPGSAALRIGGYTLAVLGLSALVTGITFAAIGLPSTDANGNSTTTTPSWAVPMVVAGLAGAAGGITMVVFSSTSIQRESAASAGRTVSVGYAGTF